MTEETPLPKLAGRCWRALDTLHVPVYFAPEPSEGYAELGIRPRAGYFVSRSAAMGAVSPDVTVATFYVFAPGLVHHVMAGCWDKASPAQVLAARHAGIVRTLRRALQEQADGEPVAEAAALAREVCSGLAPHGRPLYAAHAGLGWPEDPLLALWHAATLIREHRGDAHMATLMLAGVHPVEALVADAAVTGRREFLSTTRGWSAEEWAQAEEDLRSHGRLGSDGALTEAGTAWRADLEERTRNAVRPAWDAFGAQRAARLHELLRPLAAAVVASGVLPDMLRRR